MARALHELLEIQEMTSFKSLCLTKSKTMKALVSDPHLKEIMQQDVDTSTRQLQEFASILSDQQHE
ncbi:MULTISPECIES: hypothetical protein [Bacillus]|jgi:hypothetical protein|uniref:Spore coat protein n=1 Tax=Bacillus amyloliquefaciens (strain ATCC 23350 / DSM 7 / BCRC 11601 / CCUG 28519 / NBRC 15535 / NRRL B-14393 / F) TaxID=692420 RepID=A0A9P1JEW9_BACAS|nr:hypothetical protein [Bacillus amyloliquefaciens]AIW32591.1 hypothetical protein KS08_02620 [Bacillus subtilis]AEB22695.1 hypothetical protein BAMTA208_02540 [Bacillus amyloliquefaciens TA208]AEB62070.1 hypothetical protein LL3_00522 [Bacillus amyloliquefaciens LL3]AEK87678.1 spore coat protein [Bacillus amyloliquefaciens XH7]ARW37698.1 uncharacterized protein S101267_00582 [Bacillus amyloliquefaciens]